MSIRKNIIFLIRSSALRIAKINASNLDSSTSIVDWFDIQNKHANIKSIFIATDDSIRGSGWFNEAISRGIPILFLKKNMSEVFSRTFPGYNYKLIQSVKDFDIAIKDLKILNSSESRLIIESFNNDFQKRFNSITSIL